MGTKTIYLLSIGLALAQMNLRAGQPNDNFAERTVLSGAGIVFRGNLTDSTVEPFEPTSAPGWPNFPATHSVWWSWTATETKPVTIIALNYSEDTIFSQNQLTSVLAVYAETNVFGLPATPAMNSFWLDAAFDQLSTSFQAVAGTTYQIQFFGIHPTLEVTFRLVATNPPVILESPQPQTVFPGGSALFTVLATSLSSITYQWCFQGSELPGKTSPMLALNKITADQAGAYSVVVSNATGAVTSTPSFLQVTSSANRPILAPASGNFSNSFAFTLIGEEGRYYRILSSTDLVSWQNECSFSAFPVPLIYPSTGAPKISVVYNSGPSNVLCFPRTANAKFVRAQVYSAPDEVCINNLKQIRFAEQLWLRRQIAPMRDLPVPINVLPEITDLYCPAAGGGPVDASYMMSDLLTAPQCIIVPTHVLEEP